ncbi:type II toxin-antitoxin system HicB family antitoxin [Paenibacillus sp. 2TAB26]|uniref:type II toxin-antitoxin system HicB family antitoxin n=1 Tax=Paenibacillus sp. 2TAB26 TaxID=3233005 RepID=UPI003F99ECCC
MNTQFTILVEADFGSNNFTAYVPELRLSAVGDTEEEALDLAKDLIQMELERNPAKSRFISKVYFVDVEVQADSENNEKLQTAV